MALSTWPIREGEMKVPYAVLRMHFPDTDTCAVRMSLALLGAGFLSPGTYPVKAGKYKGKAIETRQRKLSNWLVHHLGEPERYKSGMQAQQAIGARRGIISFFQLHGPTDQQGHIAVVAKDQWQTFRCGPEYERSATGCFWDAVEIWF